MQHCRGHLMFLIWIWLRDVLDSPTAKRHRSVLNELSTRLLDPIMNLILAALCLTILLRSSLLRRRASFAPVMAVVAMGIVMAIFMSATNMIDSITDFVILAFAQFIVLAVILGVLYKK